jgi:hypothetical protein
MWIQPATANSPTDDMNKVGYTKLTVLLWDIYESTLYSSNGEYQQAQRPIALKIRYLRNIKASKLIKQTRKEWQHLGVEHDETELWLSQLALLWPDIKQDDELIFMVDEQTNTFYHNGKPIGGIKNNDFSRYFLDIWLSEKCRFPKLRAQLVGELVVNLSSG